MAHDYSTHSGRFASGQAQSAQQNRDNHNQNQQTAHDAADPTVRARQRRAEAERRRENRWERWRARETTIARRVSIHQPGPKQDARDHRGEVA